MSEAASDGLARIDAALKSWWQGDAVLDSGAFSMHLADLRCPLTAEAREVAAQTAIDPDSPITGVASEFPGFVVVSQTCDVVKPCSKSPFVEVAALIVVSAGFLEEVRKLRRPTFAYVPGVADRFLIADLNRVVTVEKAVVANWARVAGCRTDEERRAFADAVGRKRTRFAFPDLFNENQKRLKAHFEKLSKKKDAETAHLNCVTEIRVRAAPQWGADKVELFYWFIKEKDPAGAQWASYLDKWISLIDQKGPFTIAGKVCCPLDGMTARDYVESDRLDLDQLSAPAVVRDTVTPITKTRQTE